MTVNLKFTIRQKIFIIIGVVFWVIYFVQSYKLYSQVSSFITPGSSYIIKVLEFTNYRASELSTALIFYFILISINSCFFIYDYKQTNETNRKSFIYLMIFSYLVLLAIIFYITNIFSPVYIVLTLLANIIVMASFFISNVIWGKTTTFEENDIIFKSESYELEDDAKKDLDNMFNQVNHKHIDKLQGELFEDNHKFYFEIYALDRITLDSKGDFQFYEDI